MKIVNVAFGVCAVLLGLIVNSANLGYFSLDGTIDSMSVKLAVLVIQAGLVTLGMFVIIKRPIPSLAAVSLMLFSTVASTILGCIALQVLVKPRPILSGWSSWHSVREAEKNQLGHRGQPIAYSDEDYVVVLVGDSQVEALASDGARMPERLLESYLDIGTGATRVFSIAASSWGNDQEYLALQKYYDQFRADLVVVWMTFENDIWNNMFPTVHANIPKPTFWLEDQVLLGPSESMCEPIADHPIVAASLLRRCTASVRCRDRVWEQRLPPAYGPTIVSEALFEHRWQYGRPSVWDYQREKSHHALALTPRSKRTDYALRLTNSILNAMRRLVESHSGEMIAFHLDYPDEVNFPPQQRPAKQVQIVAGEHYVTSNAQWLENVQSVYQGIEALEVEVTIPDFQVGPTDPHLNDQANDQVMRDLATMIHDRHGK